MKKKRKYKNYNIRSKKKIMYHSTKLQRRNTKLKMYILSNKNLKLEKFRVKPVQNKRYF